jgi:hypothetical protein
MRLEQLLAAGLVAAFVAPAASFAQTAADEAGRLAVHLGLPDTTTVTAAPLPGIPAARPLRVYLAFGMDMQVRDNFLGWIKKWNDKDAKKHGAIVLVTKLEDADLVFARYARRDEKARHLDTNVRAVPTTGTTTTTANASGGTTTDANAWSDGAYASGRSNSSSHASGSATTTTTGTAVVSEQYTYDTVPVFAYILRRTQSGVEILWRYTNDIPTGYVETKDSGRNLFEDFKKLAKDRPRI